MRKQVFGRRLKRDKNERKALFNGLISAMVINGKIQTTEEKAKSIKGELEKLVTKAKKEQAIARRLLQSHLKPLEIEKMVNEIAPRFKNRAGGYTRIIKTGKRFNDNASMVIMSWVKGEEILLPKTAEKPATTETPTFAKAPASQRGESAGKQKRVRSKTKTSSTKTKITKKTVRKSTKKDK